MAQDSKEHKGMLGCQNTGPYWGLVLVWLTNRGNASNPIFRFWNTIMVLVILSSDLLSTWHHSKSIISSWLLTALLCLTSRFSYSPFFFSAWTPRPVCETPGRQFIGELELKTEAISKDSVLLRLSCQKYCSGLLQHKRRDSWMQVLGCRNFFTLAPCRNLLSFIIYQ